MIYCSGGNFVNNFIILINLLAVRNKNVTYEGTLKYIYACCIHYFSCIILYVHVVNIMCRTRLTTYFI